MNKLTKIKTCIVQNGYRGYENDIFSKLEKTNNKDFFVNNDINAPRADKDYFVDLSIIETVDVSFAASEVKRHIFCHC